MKRQLTIACAAEIIESRQVTKKASLRQIEASDFTGEDEIAIQNALEDLLTSVSRAPGDPAYVISARVGPTFARLVLKGTSNIRPTARGDVLKYRRAMDAGEWHAAGDSIGFHDNGALVNGFHRLTALSGSTAKSIPVTIQLAMTTLEAKRAVDQGKPRTVAWALDISTYDMSIVQAAFVACTSRQLRGSAYDRKPMVDRIRPTLAEVKIQRRWRSAFWGVVLIARLNPKLTAVVDNFIRDMCEDASTTPSTSMLKMRLMTGFNVDAKRTARQSAEAIESNWMQTLLTMQTLRHYIEGRQITKLIVRNDSRNRSENALLKWFDEVVAPSTNGFPYEDGVEEG